MGFFVKHKNSVLLNKITCPDKIKVVTFYKWLRQQRSPNSNIASLYKEYFDS